MNTLSNTIRDHKGYTLLFAVLTAALVLGVAAFILNVSQKQFLLSSTAKNSTYSIYAADSGIECGALAYLGGYLATTSQATLACAGATATASWASDSTGPVPTPLSVTANPVFEALNVKVFFSDGSCSIVSFYDGYEADGVKHHFIIDSRGYNIGTVAACPGTNPSTVERAIELRYD